MIAPGFAVISRVLLQTGRIAVVAAVIAATAEISHLL
jgi:hypothetical protein